MARFMVNWTANPSAWPTDPKARVDVIAGTTGGGDHLVSTGAIVEMGWFSAQEGYAIFEADSKASVLGMVQGFFPYFTPDVREVVPWQDGAKAILESARQAAAR